METEKPSGEIQNTIIALAFANSCVPRFVEDVEPDYAPYLVRQGWKEVECT